MSLELITSFLVPIIKISIEIQVFSIDFRSKPSFYCETTEAWWIGIVSSIPTYIRVQALRSSCHSLIMDERRGFYGWRLVILVPLTSSTLALQLRTGVTKFYRTWSLMLMQILLYIQNHQQHLKIVLIILPWSNFNNRHIRKLTNYRNLLSFSLYTESWNISIFTLIYTLK